MNNYLNLLRELSVNAVEEKKPVNLLFGVVSNTAPLEIKVEQKLILTKEMLILANCVTDFEERFEYGDEEFTLIHKNALETGEKVLLVRMQGGQKYVVLDRISEVV